MATRTAWDPADHPRGPLGRFVTVAQRDSLTDVAGRWRNQDALRSEWDRSLDGPRQTSDEMNRYTRDLAFASRLNGNLRSGKKPTPAQAKVAAGLDRDTKASRVVADTAVFRGVKRGALGDVAPGDTLVDRGFMSTTVDPDTGISFSDSGGTDAEILEIELPAGTRVGRGNEIDREIVLGRGAQLQVLAVDEVQRSVNPILRTSVSVRRIQARFVGYVED